MAASTPPPGGATLPKSARVLNRRDFLLVQQKGRKMADGLFLALALPTTRGEQARLGITVSSKVGNAVERARIRRHLREAYRRRRAAWPRVDVVVIARQAAKDADSAAFHRAFDTLTARLRQAFP